VRSRDMSAAGHDPLRGLLESAGALLVCELAGREISIDAQCARAEEVLHASSAREVRVVGEARDVERLRAARARIHGSLGRESAEAISLDLLVPRARLPRVLSGIAACGERHGLRIAHVFHAGDAILRPTILLDGEDEQQSGRAHAACGEIQRLCIAAGGEPVSPAGVGLSRRETLELLWSSHELALMDQVRRILDPWGEVNPGKILPGGMEGRASGEEGAAADELIDGVTSPARPARREPTAETAAQAFAERVLTPGEAEIARVIRQYAENREPLTPVGGGTLMVTAVEGPRLTPEGLRAVGAYDPVAMALTVEAGVTLAEIETLLAREGQTLAWEAPDPARATIGGVVAAGYWGSKAQAYHHPKHSVLGLRAITGEGELLACGGRGMKRGLGYDLSRLLIGSRGTLGVISQLTLRTYPLAPHRAVMTLTGSGEDLIRFAEHLMVAEREWTAVDLLFDPERSLLLVGYEGPTREEFTEAEGILRRLLADLRRKGETGRVDEQLAEGEAVKGARRVSAEWLSWDEAEIIVRLVVSPGAALAVARQAREQLCGNGRGGDPERGQAGEEAVFAYKPGAHPVPVEEESDSLRFRLQVHPGIGLIRVAFMPGFREPSLRRLLLALAEMVREAKGYRAIDRAPAAHWWGWDAWGAVRELHERMRRVKLAFDPRAVLSPDLIEG
jgi:FAD/FMN-containing dehydrogenase